MESGQSYLCSYVVRGQIYHVIESHVFVLALLVYRIISSIDTSLLKAPVNLFLF